MSCAENKPGRAIDGVVEAVPVVGKEHVAGHFTGERSADFLHLGLDDGVPGGPHHGGAAVRLDVVEKAAGALHVRDDRGAGLAGQQLTGVEGQDFVAEKQAPVGIDDAEAVGVSIQPDAEIGLFFLHAGHERLHVGLYDGIGVVVGEIAVRLAEHGDDRCAEFGEDVRADFTARAVAAVEHHFDRAGQLEAAEDILLVRGDDVDARSRPRALGEGAFLKNGLDLLDFFAVNGGLSGPYLEPVVFRRVVAGRYHDAGNTFQLS